MVIPVVLGYSSPTESAQSPCPSVALVLMLFLGLASHEEEGIRHKLESLG
jgi:hypothetical protein